MSSTKTPQRLTRFDQYRERKTRNQRIAAIAVGIAVPVALLIGAVRVLGSNGDPHVPATTPSVSVTPPPVSGRSVTFKAPFTYTVPSDWTFSGDGDRYFSLETPGRVGHACHRAQQRRGGSDGLLYSAAARRRHIERRDDELALDAPGARRHGASTREAGRGDRKLCGRPACRRLESDMPERTRTRHGPSPDDPQSWSINGFRKERLYVLDLPSGDTVTIVITAASRAASGA